MRAVATANGMTMANHGNADRIVFRIPRPYARQSRSMAIGGITTAVGLERIAATNARAAQRIVWRERGRFLSAADGSTHFRYPSKARSENAPHSGLFSAPTNATASV